jgi:hypothetical protein
MTWVWDPWQVKVLNHQGNQVIRAGRQSGKSEVISEKAMRFALENAGTTTLIIAAAQRQSQLIFEKVRGRLDELPDIYADKPTLTRVVLTNGSRIYCVPAGRTGYSIRGYTVDLLIADEAAYIPEQVWLAVTPMMAVSETQKGFGWSILISTPFGKGGYFYECCHDSDFLHTHVSTEDCKRVTKKFLQQKKRSLSKAQYAQEFLAEFTDEYRQFFPTKLIKERMNFIEWSKKTDYDPNSSYYLGVDFAGYGGDENAFVIAEINRKKRVKIVRCMTTERTSAPDTIARIQLYHETFNFKRIFVDDGGLGSPITDLLKEKIGKRTVMGLNNSSKRITEQGEEKKRGIFKEDLYSHALMLMETQMIDLIADPDLMRSLKSITFEYTADKNLKIKGSYSHLTEAFVRACWALRERGLRLYMR